MSAQKLYDLTMLIGMIGEEEGLQLMLNIFLESTPKILEELNDSYEKRDFETLAKNGHKLKASLDMMKISSLYDVIRLIDKHEKVNANKNHLDAIIQQINATLGEVFVQLKQEPLLIHQG
jgi:HPt (histidine-containing phosphotransfer) domain-containing protein